MPRVNLLCRLLSLLLLCATLPTQAEEWQYEFTPYIWGSSLDITAGKDGSDHTVDEIQFHDIYDMLDAGWMSMFEARKGNWSVMNDIIWMKLSDGGSKQLGPLAGTTLNANLKTQEGSLDLVAGYTPDNSHTTFFAGLRYFYLLADVSASLAPPIPGAFVEAGTKQQFNWTTPLVGVRQIMPITDKFSAVGQIDVGGTMADEFSSAATLRIKYDITDTLNTSLGYRYVRIRMNSDNVLFDQTAKGFMATVGFKF